MKDYYKILELEKTASQEEIKKSFRRLSKVLHPDKETGDAEKFKELNEAYQTLSDKAKKRAYDSGSTYKPIPPPVVNNITLSIPWTLEDIKSGKTFSILVDRVVVCKTCNGIGSKTASAITTCSHCGGRGSFSKQEQMAFGFVMMEHTCMHCRGVGELNSDPCPTCQGQKMVNESITETVIIPASTIGTYTKQGAGHKTIHGDSDLLIALRINDQGVTATFDGLHKVIRVNPFDAVLGKEQLVIIHDKTLKVSLPKNSKGGQAFKLKKAYYDVDVIIYIVVEPPTLDQTKEFVLNLFEKDKDILPKVTKRINETFK